MSLLQNLQKKYANAALLSLHVPEWDITIYYKPLRGDELDVIKSVTPEGCTAARSNAQVVVTKSLDKDGVRLFPSNDDATGLYESGSHPEVLTRIAQKMWEVTPFDKAEKNSSANPAS